MRIKVMTNRNLHKNCEEIFFICAEEKSCELKSQKKYLNCCEGNTINYRKTFK